MMPSIIVKDLSKRYQMGTGLMDIRDILNLRQDSQTKEYHWAVKGVSFELQQG